MGSLNNLLNSNYCEWSLRVNDHRINEYSREIIIKFLRKDNLSVHMYTENEKAWNIVEQYGSLSRWLSAQSSSVYEANRNQRITPSPSFKKHYSENLFEVNPSLPT